MWLQVAMVANVLVAERESRIGQVERIRFARGETESRFANDPFRLAALLVAMLVVATVGRMILV